ncbi:MAG: hypothetical protein JW913_07545 [Chitinispirillaceae bacterium]|nr:hypothetical protein [Chitinispirillaceae bacterium]
MSGKAAFFDITALLLEEIRYVTRFRQPETKQQFNERKSPDDRHGSPFDGMTVM